MATLADILDRSDELADQLSALTDRANARSAGPVAAQLEQAQRATVADWIRRFGSIDARPDSLPEINRFVDSAQARLNTVFASAAAPAERALAHEWTLAYTVGIEHGLESAPHSPERAVGRRKPAALGVAEAVEAQRLKATARLGAVQVLADGFPSVARALRTADALPARLEAANAFHLTRAATEGATAVAEQTGAARMWVAERDACVACLAYAGVTTMVDVFPVGLTFGDKPLVPPGPLVGPALHAHCRCAIELIDPNDTAIPAALKREAKRSVLRGFSLPSESEQARLRAADRLLSQYPGLPKTVEAYARRAVQRGRFPTRAVPPSA